MIAKCKAWAARILMALAIALIASALAYSLPLDFALLVAVDVAAYFEAVLGVCIVAQTAPWRVVVRKAQNRLKQIAARIRAKPTPHETGDRPTYRLDDRRQQPANDDGRPAPIQLAA